MCLGCGTLPCHQTRHMQLLCNRCLENSASCRYTEFNLQRLLSLLFQPELFMHNYSTEGQAWPFNFDGVLCSVLYMFWQNQNGPRSCMWILSTVRMQAYKRSHSGKMVPPPYYQQALLSPASQKQLSTKKMLCTAGMVIFWSWQLESQRTPS